MLAISRILFAYNLFVADAKSSGDVPRIVAELLGRAVSQRASDLHLEPTAQGCEARLRVDGLLQTIAQFDAETGRAMVGRLMVLAHLLTYRLDVPQEGRLSFSTADGSPPMDLRLAVMPRTHGLRAAVRMPAELVQPSGLDALQLPQPVLAGLKRFSGAESGMLILTGPAGSGKTTTIYALGRCAEGRGMDCPASRAAGRRRRSRQVTGSFDQ